MSIYVSYGRYQHGPGEVEYRFNRELLMNERKDPWAYRTNVQMRGRLIGDGVSDMTTKVQSLEAAYARQNQDWVVNNDGEPLEISIYSSNTVYGVRVKRGPTYPTNQNAAHVTFLDYEIELEADVIIASQINALRSFEETLTLGGGGPRFLHLETAVGLPIKQLGRRHIPYRASQTGRAVGLFYEPRPPRPIFPNDLVSNGEFGYDSGNFLGGTITDLGVTWNYQFESSRPMAGRPNRWGTT